MGLIRHTRKLLNISQRDLGEYLSIPRNTLKMVEDDLRYLSNEKFSQVIDLNQHLELAAPLETLTEAQAYLQTEQQDLQAYLQQEMVMLREQQRQWQQKLETQQATYQKLLRAYHAFTQAKAAMSDKPEHQQSWLRLHHRLTKEKLKKNGRKAQIQLETKLARIASELEVLEQHLSQ